MHRKERDPESKIPSAGFRRHGQVHRNLEEPIEESPETLEKAVGTGQRIPRRKPPQEAASDNPKR
jgi:hypothetical protein